MLCHPCVVGGPLHKGTETKVAHKRAEVLCHPCVLVVRQGGPLGSTFFLLRTACKDHHYGIFSRSPARATFELLFGTPKNVGVTQHFRPLVGHL